MAIHRHPWVPLGGIQVGLGPKTLRYCNAATSTFGGLRNSIQFGWIPATVIGYVMGVAHNELTARATPGGDGMPADASLEIG